MGGEESVPVSGVSLFQGLICVQEWLVGKKGILILQGFL